MNEENKPRIIKQPYVIIYEGEENNVACELHAPKDFTHQHYGLLIADLIRHVANHYKVDEDEILDWIKREIYTPTTKIDGGTVQ